MRQTKARKEVAQEITTDATFKLHKWHSNRPELEEDSRQEKTEVQSTQLKAREKGADSPAETEEQSYAKQQLQVKPSESKLLGVKWNKFEDTITVQFPVANTSGATSKREVLAKLAKVYDPLSLACPVTLQGQTNLPRSVRPQSSMGRTHPRESQSTMAKVGTVTPRRDSCMKTDCTASATSSLIRATCIQRRIDTWSQSRGVLGRTPRR